MFMIKLIATDLDGTLLTTDKRLTPENETALRDAAAAGIEIVPATGRYFGVIPATVRALPFIRYYITVNGAQIYDAREDRVLARAELPWQTAVALMNFFDALPVIYDCYQDNRGWITEAFQKTAPRYARSAPVLEMLLKYRTPVPELKAFLREQGRPVQKVMVFFQDDALRLNVKDELTRLFPALSVTSSVENNLEINSGAASKGNALKTLAEALQIPMEQTMAFGDDLNDASMLRAAGIGVAMDNASPEAVLASDERTSSCDESGVAARIRKIPGIL